MIKKRESKELRERLTERRDRLLAQLRKLEEELKYLDQSHPPEFSEEAQEKAAASSLVALDNQERKELADIQSALEKLDKDTYGTCERCSKAIGETRLRALPMVRHCISCQKKIEEGASVAYRPLFSRKAHQGR
ncbi:MAG TPA: TraR/DksA family transcriptional regulator [Acidobacteriota bacterium]|nr:TraR/DksA family transcriptional regulator [Acidobacteriota bacterium]